MEPYVYDMFICLYDIIVFMYVVVYNQVCMHVCCVCERVIVCDCVSVMCEILKMCKSVQVYVCV